MFVYYKRKVLRSFYCCMRNSFRQTRLLSVHYISFTVSISHYFCLFRPSDFLSLAIYFCYFHSFSLPFLLSLFIPFLLCLSFVLCCIFLLCVHNWMIYRSFTTGERTVTDKNGNSISTSFLPSYNELVTSIDSHSLIRQNIPTAFSKFSHSSLCSLCRTDTLGRKISLSKYAFSTPGKIRRGRWCVAHVVLNILPSKIKSSCVSVYLFLIAFLAYSSNVSST
jgi:hypothetical protein